MDGDLHDVVGDVGSLPRNWERAFGYKGDAQLVAFYWTPAGDEAMYDDGRAGGDGNWRLYLDLKDERPILEDVNLGYSDAEADFWLLLDRESRHLVVLPTVDARRRLAAQWPPAEPVHLTEEEVAAFYQAMANAVDQANREWRRAQPQTCPICFSTATPGWLPAEDGGFDECPACHGRAFVQEVEGND